MFATGQVLAPNTPPDKNYFQKEKKKTNKLNLMSQSPQLPDLNPIQLVWDEPERKVKAQQPASASDLCTML